jgi:hypothetical protein
MLSTLGSVLLMYRTSLKLGASGPAHMSFKQHWALTLDAPLGAQKRNPGGYGIPEDHVRVHTNGTAIGSVLAQV